MPTLKTRLNPAQRAVRGTLEFTLIELLVVISIIAILMSLMLPALKSARDLSKQTVCMGNLRQTGGAVFSYADDNGAFMPDYYNTSGTAGVNRYWEDLLQTYTNAKYKSTSNPRYKSTIFDCPSFATDGGGDCDMGDYTYHLLFWCLSSSTTTDLRKVLRPSRTGLVADGGRNEGTYANAKIGYVDEDWATARFLRNRHSEGLNILHCDGHVNWRHASLGDSLSSTFRYDAQ